MIRSTNNLRPSISAKPRTSVEKSQDNKTAHHTVWWNPEDSPENKQLQQEVREQKKEQRTDAQGWT